MRFLIVADAEPDAPFLEVVKPEATSIAFRVAKVRPGVFLRVLGVSWQPSAVALVLRERPDLVIAQGSPYVLTAWVLVLVGRLRRIPVLLWSHGLLVGESGLKWWIRRTFYRLGSGLLLYGDRAKALLLQKGLREDQLHVVYNSVSSTEGETSATWSDSERRSFRERLGVRAEERLVSFSGRLQAEKRLPLLLQALALLGRRGKRVHLALIGDGTDEVTLRRIAAELGIDDLVHFLGSIYDDGELGLAFSAGDLSVIPAAAGLSVIHALTYGTPVVLHDRVEEHGPEWEAVVEGVTGWFYRFDDVEDLAETMACALFPSPRKASMADACREMVERRYNSRKQAEAILAAVEHTLAKARPR
jgi:glycosyltransferase involved in cell wall biosynthesis